MSNWATINELNTMQSVIDELRAENDKLREQVLKAPDAKMVAFIAAFELWIQDEVKSRNHEGINGDVDYGASLNICDTWLTWYKLKAQHLEAEGEGDE
jgi:hypothetical protein